MPKCPYEIYTVCLFDLFNLTAVQEERHKSKEQESSIVSSSTSDFVLVESILQAELSCDSNLEELALATEVFIIRACNSFLNPSFQSSFLSYSVEISFVYFKDTSSV